MWLQWLSVASIFRATVQLLLCACACGIGELRGMFCVAPALFFGVLVPEVFDPRTPGAREVTGTFFVRVSFVSVRVLCWLSWHG